MEKVATKNNRSHNSEADWMSTPYINLGKSLARPLAYVISLKKIQVTVWETPYIWDRAGYDV